METLPGSLRENSSRPNNPRCRRHFAAGRRNELGDGGRFALPTVAGAAVCRSEAALSAGGKRNRGRSRRRPREGFRNPARVPTADQIRRRRTAGILSAGIRGERRRSHRPAAASLSAARSFAAPSSAAQSSAARSSAMPSSAAGTAVASAKVTPSSAPVARPAAASRQAGFSDAEPPAFVTMGTAAPRHIAAPVPAETPARALPPAPIVMMPEEADSPSLTIPPPTAATAIPDTPIFSSTAEPLNITVGALAMADQPPPPAPGVESSAAAQSGDRGLLWRGRKARRCAPQ